MQQQRYQAKQRKRVRCGNCGSLGHNRRTCKVVVETNIKRVSREDYWNECKDKRVLKETAIDELWSLCNLVKDNIGVVFEKLDVYIKKHENKSMQYYVSRLKRIYRTFKSVFKADGDAVFKNIIKKFLAKVSTKIRIDDANNTVWLRCISKEDYYTGEFVNGLPEGKGFMEYSNGDLFIGCWSGGEMTSTDEYDGYMEYANSNIYKGKWLNGKRSGYGVFEDIEGLEYRGEWLDDKKHGEGMEYDTDGFQGWRGVWKNGLFVSGLYYEDIYIYKCDVWDENQEMNGKCVIEINKDMFMDGEIDDHLNICGETFFVHGKEVKNAEEINALTDDCCAVCQEDIFDQICITKCGHAFHTACLLKCFQHKSTCPLCRAELVV